MLNNLLMVAVVGTAGSSWFSSFLEIYLGDTVKTTFGKLPFYKKSHVLTSNCGMLFILEEL